MVKFNFVNPVFDPKSTTKFYSETIGLDLEYIGLLDDIPYFLGPEIQKFLKISKEDVIKFLKNYNQEDTMYLEQEIRIDKKKDILLLISEFGLNLLLVSVNNKKTEKARLWFSLHVMPSIRKYGGYIYKEHPIVKQMRATVHKVLLDNIRLLVAYSRQKGCSYDNYKNTLDYITNILLLAHGATKDNMNEAQLLYIRINELLIANELLMGIIREDDYDDILENAIHSAAVAELSEE